MATMVRDGQDDWFLVTYDAYERWVAPGPAGQTRRSMALVRPHRETVRVHECRARLDSESGKHAVALLSGLRLVAQAQPSVVEEHTEMEMDPLPGL